VRSAPSPCPDCSPRAAAMTRGRLGDHDGWLYDHRRDEGPGDLLLEAHGRAVRLGRLLRGGHGAHGGAVLLRRGRDSLGHPRGSRGHAAAPRRAGARRGKLRADRERDRRRLALRPPRIYSGFESASNGGGGGGGTPPSGEAPPEGGLQPGDAGAGRSARSDEKTYLRGAQATNSDGIVEFRTIYPGWYRGRTTHIHAKVHLSRSTLLTTPFFTTRERDDVVHARAPYSEDAGRDTFNEGDDIYARRAS